MKIRVLTRHIDYDGTQLRSHWAYRTLGLQGDSGVAFIGKCDVPLEHMVDLADVRRRAPIFSRLMLHFLIEHFGIDLEKAILRQRLFAQIACEEIAARCERPIQRRGDDLYDGRAKLSVSIATASSVSTPIHFGINIDAQGAPVRARGLSDYGIDPLPLARAILKHYAGELDDIAQASTKVRPVD